MIILSSTSISSFMTSKLPKQHFFKAITLLTILLHVAFSGYAQKKQTYNLLWEITGKSLTKPSYIFGAASFKDRRVFNFSDSVMKALESSSALVMEVHPDSIINLAFQQLSTIKGLKESLTPAQTKAIFDQFKGKHGYAPDSALLANPFQIAELMKPDYTRPDDMPSAVDGYLYGIARTLKKKILAFNEPLGTINYDDAVAKAKEYLEHMDQELDIEGYDEMMDIFASGNTEEIVAFLDENFEEGFDLTDQNKPMAEHIIAMLNNDGLFFAISLENLAGKNGVITLLKNAGYQLRPVEASFTGVAKTYTIDYAKMDWYTYENKAEQFRINFPSTPIALGRVGGAKPIVYADVSNDVLYTASSLFTGPLTNFTSEQYIDTVFNEHATRDHYHVINKKKYSKYGTTVLEVDFKRNGKYARMMLVHHNQIYYTIAVESRVNNLHEPFADLFFNSFAMTAPVVVSAAEWIAYEHKEGAFALKIPVAAESIPREIENTDYPDRPYVLNMYSSSDKANQINYVFRYNDFPSGIYLSDKKAVFDGITSNLEQNGQIVDQKRTIYKDGYEGRTLSAIVQGTYLELQVYLRGNRTYVLLLQNMKGTEKPKNNTYFDSFKFLPYSALKGDTATLGNMEVTMPATPIRTNSRDEKEEDEEKYSSYLDETEVISATNKHTGGVFGIEKNQIRKYFRTKNIDSTYNAFIDRLNSTNATAKKVTDITIGTLKGKETITVDSLTNTSKKTRIWFQGNDLYFQTLISSSDEIAKGEFAHTFFNNLKVKTSEKLFDFASSKAKLITQDLLSKDSETYKGALGALSYYKFDKDELPHIYDALQQKYADDTTTLGARATLLNEFVSLSDAKTTEVLKNLYQASSGVDVVRGKILSIITDVNKDNYDWYFKSIVETPTLTLKNRWDLFAPLTDSISYAATHFDQLVPMLHINEYRPMILDVVATMLNEKNKKTYQGIVTAKKDLIVKYVFQDLDEDIKRIKAKEYTATTYNYLSILPQLDAKLTDEYTAKIFPLDSVAGLITEALTARIIANLPLNEQLVAAQLDSLTTRYRVIYAFHKAGKLAAVPAKYKRHDEFAKLLMHDYLFDEYGAPNTLKYLGTVKEGKDTYFAFDFTYIEDEVTKNYIGLSGPFSPPTLNGDELDFDNYYSYSDFEPKSTDWMKQAKEMIKVFKKK